MPKVAQVLPALSVRNITRPGLHFVGGVNGLALRVSPNGAKSWVLRVKVGDKRQDIGLGPFPTVTLEAARTEARRKHQEIREGRDPIAERRAVRASVRAEQARALTFRDAAEGFIAMKAAGWKNPKSAAQWLSSLASYAFPSIGRLDVSDIGLHHVEAILKPIWSTKTETASRVRGRIEAILNFAIAGGHRAAPNPAVWRGLLDNRLSAPAQVRRVKHHPAVPFDEIPRFYADLKEMPGIAARALEFVLMTAARSGEVRGATWAEIDLQGAIWTIPENRMKAGRMHRVPLSEQAVAILKALPRLEGSDVVFPNLKGKVLSDMTLSAVMRRMKIKAVPHGLRSSFSDWTAERTSYTADVREMALSHAIKNKAEAAYRRGDLLEVRRSLMQEWCKHITSNTQ